jgi:elongation factor G
MVTSPGHPKARTVALIGRTGVGKSTLLEALAAGSAGRGPAKGDDSPGLGGGDPEERKHATTLGVTMAPVWVGEDKLTLLDTPGFFDFLGETERALEVADLALLVVHAGDGATAETEVIWQLARDAGVPVVVFVNALDAERADFEATLGSLEAMVGPILAPLELPIGAGGAFEGVVDLLADEAITYADGVARRGPVPEGLAALETRVRDSLLEAIVVGDDSLAERYLEGDTPVMAELEDVLGHLLAAGTLVPVTCGSAARGVGLDRLVSLLDEIAESRPIPAVVAGEATTLERDPDAEVVLRAFKVVVDPYVGRIVVLEVLSGTLMSDAVLVNTRTHAEERLHQLAYLRGRQLVPVERALAGDVVAVAKLHDVQVGDVLARKGLEVTAALGAAPTPALSVALVTASREDDEKVATALHRLAEEDSALRVRHDPTTRRLVVDVMGEVHLQVTLERLARRFSLAVATEAPTVELFETILTRREVEGRLKKQTGGHGQFAVVNLTVEPIEPTAPLEFVDAVVGGAVPRQYIPAVRNGVERAMAHGGPQGHPVVGLRVTLTDGKFHSVDSSEAAFETAAASGLRGALEDGSTVVLERIMQVQATVPVANLGDVLNDLSGRRGRVIGTDQDDEVVVTVTAHVPEASLHRYGLDLRGLTSGRGRVRVSPHHLAEAPRTGAR